MRRPPAIFRCRSNLREFRAASDLLSDTKPCQAFHTEVPVKSEELVSVVSAFSKLMPQNHDRPIIERRLVVRKRTNHALQWRANCATRRDLQIDSQMNGAPLVSRFFARAKQR